MVPCAKCNITYAEGDENPDGCPLCVAIREQRKASIALTDLRNTVAGLKRQLNGLSTQVDLVVAIRQASSVMDANDLAWFKGALYIYRANKSTSITVKGVARGQRRVPVEAIFVQRGVNNDHHRLTSPGGVAVAAYYDEATRELGVQSAMHYLIRGMSHELGGGRALGAGVEVG